MTEFELATANDLPKIVEIYNQAIPGRLATADLDPVTVASKQAWFQAFDANQHPIWVIKVNHQIAGWVSLAAFHERAAYRKTVEISIYFDQQFQHQGLGQQALTFVETQVKRLGVTTIVALIFAHNQPSQGLFLKNGFEKWAHLPDVAELDEQSASVDILGKHY
ncbi:GNAT family N-acetyltransferase [Fructilactobacillus frigidiflavus]|uniref:GNAT family N-acetyltransferase n=1 Tax=Fructilactobacillus frigidiflavus TaxID=3242688 RepID=UPI003756445F